ncbi:cadherin-like and PC-esterase domain-containing protein 1 [Leuresthes tenuis]|uniref:cadherin-like and PC-esterase domain-containing protein 1 n=1 Tax=Leuresthes tenuis TaxID=355514 RepID=UPI003B50B3F9
MRRLLGSAGGLLFLPLRTAGMLLRRRACAGPLLLALLCLCYQTLIGGRSRSGPQRPTDEVLMETRRLLSTLEALLRETQVQLSPPGPPRRAVVLTGRHLPSDTEVQLYQRVLQQMNYEVHTSRYAETSRFLRTQQGAGGWSLLLCLSSSERSCLRRIASSHLQQHQMVRPTCPGVDVSVASSLIPSRQVLFLLSEPDLPMKPHSCGLTNHKLPFPPDSRPPVQAPPPALVAMVNVYVLVTSMTPLTSFLHDISVVMTNQQLRGRTVKIRDFLLQQLGPAASHHALGQVKRVIGEVLQAVATNEEQESAGRCALCFQLLTFTLLFSGTITPIIVQVNTELTFSVLSDDAFSRQITKDLILEDALSFLLPPLTHLSSDAQDGGCRGTHGVCLPQDQLLLLLLFHQRLKKPSAFQLLYPSTSSSSCSSPSSSAPLGVSDLLLRISCYYELQTDIRADKADQPTNQQPASSQRKGVCVDPHLRQIYTDPPLVLTPPFSPRVREYRAEVAFDTVTVRIRPEPVSAACGVHLDEQQGPRMANYPVGLGNSRISILVTDGVEVMMIYTVHVYRESRPSLPMFGDHVTCSFMQDCGLLVRPGVPCGLQPHTVSQRPVRTCSSGHVPGRWVVPCLSCSDNRTCDWREVAWQPDGCHHLVVDRPQLQACMTDRKVLFIGDSTNRGMMYFLMERVNSSLEDWGKAHDLLVYRNLNGGRTQVSYSYYPQFWLERNRRPTFEEALLQLLTRSRPLVNSNQTVLVVGGVQWLNTNHLRTVREVLDRESLSDILVVVKSLGMGFHLPVDGVRSLSAVEIQNLFRENGNIISTAKSLGYEAIDTFSITMGRYKEFLQGRCACHFHEVEKFRPLKPSENTKSTTSSTRAGLQSAVLDTGQELGSKAQTYRVTGPVNQVYSEILLSRLCPKGRQGVNR